MIKTLASKSLLRTQEQHGFTLIEVSIVLVIIGLITGGVLVGRDLISAATMRAQIAQIEKFNTATRTFQGKYGYLPGDIPNPAASQFGFATRGAYAGEGDGSGLIEGNYGNAVGSNYGTMETTGEPAMFWVDLSQAGLIEGRFNSASSTAPLGPDVTGAGVNAYLPQAKIGTGNYIAVWSGGWQENTLPPPGDGANYFSISGIICLSDTSFVSANTTLSVQQAYAIDKKTDDGAPQSGNIVALYVNNSVPVWSMHTVMTACGGLYVSGAQNASFGPTTAATAGWAGSCYDNSTSASGTPGVNGTSQHYSVEINSGAGLNCALSFKFQ